VQEEAVKGSELSEKVKSIAYSMKLVNGVYGRLIEVFEMQVKEAENDEYTMGWNDAFKAAANMTDQCKYTKEDFFRMMSEQGDDSDEATANSV
jgi:hypothetical protein